MLFFGAFVDAAEKRFTLVHPRLLAAINDFANNQTDQITPDFNSTNSTSSLNETIEVQVSCVDTLKHITNNPISESEAFIHIMQNSGKDYNDFGSQSECHSEPDFHYYMANIQDKFPIQLSLGLCLPTPCNLIDLNSFKPYFLQAFNLALPELLKDIKGFNYIAEKGISSDDFEFLDPTVENEKVIYSNHSTTFAIALCFTIAILVTIASVKSCTKSDSKPKPKP